MMCVCDKLNWMENGWMDWIEWMWKVDVESGKWMWKVDSGFEEWRGSGSHICRRASVCRLSVTFGVIAAYCSNFGHFALLSHTYILQNAPRDFPVVKHCAKFTYLSIESIVICTACTCRRKESS